jgi:lysozyme
VRTNKAGVDLIKRFEGLRLEAYVCPAGVWTIGYGHTEHVSPWMKITAHQADAILDVDLDKFERIVANAVKVPLSENQFSALVSFVFNVGPGAKGRRDGFVWLRNGNPSTMLRRINAGDFGERRVEPETGGVYYTGAADQFGRWVSGGGKILPGLVARRAAERELFLRP